MLFRSFNNLFFGGDYGIEKSEGDITVPNRSNNSFGNWQTYEINEDHNALPTESQKIIIKELTGNESSDFVHLNYFQKAYLVRIFSPADFQIIDPQGRKIGKDFINNSAINEIPNAFYSGFQGGAEFAVIPDPLDGEYKIIVKGIASGNYDGLVAKR